MRQFGQGVQYEERQMLLHGRTGATSMTKKPRAEAGAFFLKPLATFLA
jgi:hypothetical protein